MPFLIFSTLETSFSQEGDGVYKIRQIPQRYVKMVKNDLNRVISFRPGLKHFNWERTVFWSSIIFAGFTIEKGIAEEFSNSKSKKIDNFFDFFEPLGRSRKINPVSAAAFLAGLVSRNARLTDASFTLLEGILITESIVTLLKQGTGRARPGQAGDNKTFYPGKKGYSSLPSYHTTLSFLTASIISEYYPRIKYLNYTLAGLCSIQQIVSESHWLSDVIFSALLGHYAGKLFSRSHLKLYPLSVMGNSIGTSVRLNF